MRTPGAIRRRLAAKLQREVPDIRGKAITWLPERLHRRQGNPCFGCDAFSWSGAPVYADTGNMAALVDCWHTMTECLKAKRLQLIEDRREWGTGSTELEIVK